MGVAWPERYRLSHLTSGSRGRSRPSRTEHSPRIVLIVTYRVRALTAQECDAIAGWRYEGRYRTYEFDDSPPDPADGFFAVENATGQMIGYCCYGAEARVPGVELVAGVVDVGYGMRPDWLGQGQAQPFISAILAFALARFEVVSFRALVLDWNRRSLAACRRAGFRQTGEVTTASGRFVMLERPAGAV